MVEAEGVAQPNGLVLGGSDRWSQREVEVNGGSCTVGVVVSAITTQGRRKEGRENGNIQTTRSKSNCCE